MKQNNNTTIYKPKGYNQLAKATRLPKKEIGGQVDNNFIGYQESNQQVFNPNPSVSLGGSPQYDSLTANNKFTNEQVNGVGLSSNSTQGALGISDVNASNIGSTFGGEDISKALGYASAGVNLIDNLEGGLNKNETQETVDLLGSAVGGAYYEGGKMTDQLLFGKDEQGLYDSQFDAQASYLLTDPGQTIGQGINSISEGDTLKGIGELILPGLAGSNAQKEQEAAIEKTNKDKIFAENKQKNIQNLNRINAGVQQYDNTFAKYGGKLPKKALGGNINTNNGTLITKDNENNTTTLAPSTAYVTQNVKRPLSKQSTIYELSDKLKLTPQEIEAQYNSTYLDSIANVYPEYQSGIDSVGQPNLSKIIPNNNTRVQLKQGGNIGLQTENKTPIVQKYGGQLHSGPDQGIEVDAQGNPTSVSGGEPAALTEQGEVNYNGYIFSDSIEYKK